MASAGGKKGELFEVFGDFFPSFPILNQTDGARLRLKGVEWSLLSIT